MARQNPILRLLNHLNAICLCVAIVASRLPEPQSQQFQSQANSIRQLIPLVHMVANGNGSVGGSGFDMAGANGVNLGAEHFTGSPVLLVTQLNAEVRSGPGPSRLSLFVIIKLCFFHFASYFCSFPLYLSSISIHLWLDLSNPTTSTSLLPSHSSPPPPPPSTLHLLAIWDSQPITVVRMIGDHPGHPLHSLW